MSGRPAAHGPYLALALGLLAVVAFFLPAAGPLLQYDRDAVMRGELARLVTCHVTHCSSSHLAWDVAAFVVLGALCERRSRGRFAACLALAAPAITLACLALLPGMTTYRGLSGTDAALFTLLAVELLREAVLRRQTVMTLALAAALAALGAKIVFELVTASTLFVDSRAAAMTPVPLAHIVGASAGACVALAGRLGTGAAPVRALS